MSISAIFSNFGCDKDVFISPTDSRLREKITENRKTEGRTAPKRFSSIKLPLDSGRYTAHRYRN